MLNEKHDLIHEFPEYTETIHNLKSSDVNFARWSDKYNEVDNEILRIETGIESSSDEYLEERKKIHLHLKDQLYQMIRNG